MMKLGFQGFEVMGCLRWRVFVQIFIVVMVGFTAKLSHGFTNPQDVTAINSLFVALANPTLPGWIPNGGDPCTEAWQGVTCIDSNITSITVNAANLGGGLGDNLQLFTAIKTIDLSGNHIGGSIPSGLPSSLINFFLSANQLTGSIPSTLSSLTQLSAMSLNGNQLSGELPDSFQSLPSLINLDLSVNNFSGQLPPSFENLSSLTTLHLQNNQFTGTLDVLQDLPLRDLNVENNLFSGPIPDKLLIIPNFKNNGNLFNSTVVPSLPPSAPLPFLQPPPPPVSRIPPSGETPGKQAYGPSASEQSNPARKKKFWTTKKLVWMAIAGVLVFIVILLGIVLFVSRCCKERNEADRLTKKRFERVAYDGSREKPKESASSVQPDNQIEKEADVRSKDEHGIGMKIMGAISKPKERQEIDAKRKGVVPTSKEEYGTDIVEMDRFLMPPPPPPPPPSPPPPPPPVVEKVTVRPIVPTKVTKPPSPSKILDLPSSVRSFTIASLQQYTNSFSQENFIGGGMLGSVYRAELPDGELLAVKKLDNAASRRQNDEEFLELVRSISKLRHVNIVELVGYCSEHGQRLLIYEYCSDGTLYDALHTDDELNKQLSWNARIKIALGAARALEYLHETCEPPVMHRNFKSANVLLDDGLQVRISDCGLAPLISSGSVSQLSGQLLSTYGYGAPEFETGTYTYRSDVYSFGVVMLELLTGRKSYDRSQPRGEQFLVRWAIPQLHDIDALSRMVDPSLDGAYPSKSLSRFADIISLCVQSEPEFRPSMSEIVQDLMYMIQRKPPNERDGD